MRVVKRLGLAGAVLLALFAVVTLAALEGREVVVVHTTAPDGHARTTRTWIADADGAAWIEAANPEREFYRSIAANPDVDVDRQGVTRRYHAVVQPNPEGHRRIRQLLAEKYGLADWWIGLLTDTSRSLGIRLTAQ